MSANRRLLYVTVAVILLHVIGIAWVEWFASPLCLASKSEKLVVNTIALVPQKREEPKKVSPKPKAAILKPQNKPSGPVKKNAVKKKSEPSQKEVVRKDFKKELLSRARQNLRKIENGSSAIEEVAMIHSMQIDSLEPASQDQGYYSALTACLRQSLRLPESGDVKIQLTLGCNGNVVRVKIAQSQSENNRRYVETVIPTIAFPPFGKFFNHEKEHIFTITLTSDF